MKLKFILPLCGLATSFFASGQINSSSQYSFYKLGEAKQISNNENFLMGAISATPDTIYANFKNPASLSKLVLTNLSVGGSYIYSGAKSDVSSTWNSITNFDYISLAFPVYKNLGVAVSAAPYSWTGYNIKSTERFNDEIITNKFVGDGGLSNISFSVGYKVYKQLSVGVSVKAIFGKIDTENFSASNQAYSVQQYDRSKYNGVGLNVGATYEYDINKKLKGYVSAYYSPEISLTTQNERHLSTYNGNSVTKTLDLDLGDLATASTKLPSQFCIGASISKLNTWLLGTEITFNNYSNFSNPFTTSSFVSYKNATRVAIGGSYTPRYNSFTNYFKRVTYRSGMFFENTGIELKGRSITDMGLTVGASFPMTKAVSSITIGALVGTKGTTEKNLIKENYFALKVGLSFSDRWFVKAKYN